MSVLIKVLKGFSYFWSGLVILSVVVGAVGILLTEDIGKLIRIFSPSNWVNYLLIFVLLSPAMGANILAKRLEKKIEEGKQE